MFFSLLTNPAAASDAPALTTTTTNTSPTINTSPYPDPQTKASLHLPTTAEGWETANSYFNTSLVPAVLGVHSPEEMTRLLCEGIYSYFSSSLGAKTPVPVRKRCHPPHNRSLKEVERRKREAKKELRSAKRSGSPADVVPSLARYFFSLVRVHSQLKRAAKARSLSRDVRIARERCDKGFKGHVMAIFVT